MVQGIVMFIEAFKQMFVFDGRSSRSEFWYFWLGWLFFPITLLYCLVMDFPMFLLFGGIVASWGIATAIPILLIIPNGLITIVGLSLFFRRLHDINLSGGIAFIMFIPIIGILILFILACMPGTDGPNQYGDEPIF